MSDARWMNLATMFPDLGRRTHIMAVLNATPDSFSDGGRFSGSSAAIDAAQAMLEAGADIVDIGGESTRPGAPAVSADAELYRVMPIVEGLVRAGIGDRKLSIDTTKAAVARAAVQAGTHLVNDISAMTFDPAMASTVAALGVPVVLSHTRDRPEVMQKGDLTYADGVVSAVSRSLREAMDRATAAGVGADQLIVDPGIGFGKTVEDNLELLRHIEALRALGCPVLVGTSRKSFLGKLTGRPVQDRVTATMATVALSIAHGADFVRVHDVEQTSDTVRVADAWVRGLPS